MNTLYNDSRLPSTPKRFVSYINIFQTLSNSLLRNLANLRPGPTQHTSYTSAGIVSTIMPHITRRAMKKIIVL
jgi:branched-subunit amino acid transport protein